MYNFNLISDVIVVTHTFNTLTEQYLGNHMAL